MLASAGCLGVERDRPDPLRQSPIAEEFHLAVVCDRGFIERDPVEQEILDLFPRCCNDGDPFATGPAHYIPSFLIPEGFHNRLEHGPEDAICVPDEIARDPGYSPARCEALNGIMGACLSICLPEVRNAKIELPRSPSCAPHERCVPCLDPETNLATGACDLGALACEPVPRLHHCQDLEFDATLLEEFEPCCGQGRAHCAPVDWVTKAGPDGDVDPADQRLAEQLAPCEGGQGLCVPDDFLARAGRYHPLPCRSIGNSEGRCLSICLPQVAEALQENDLPQSTCQTDERCVPCYDPLTEEPTGACVVGRCDEPQETPSSFEPCGGNGEDALCVPEQFVPPQDRNRFDAMGCGSGCTQPNTLCVPRKIIDQGEGFSPATCKPSVSGLMDLLNIGMGIGGLFLGGGINWSKFGLVGKFSDGRCLSQCLPEVRAIGDKLKQTTCGPSEICVPCYDPRAGAEMIPTGACDR